MANPTLVSALKHVRSGAPYQASSFTEQNRAIVGRSGRLRGYGLVSFTSGVSIILEPGAFISVGLDLNPSEPNRKSGIIAETAANITLDATGFTTNDDFYIFALVSSPSEGASASFYINSSPIVPPSQNAPIAKYIAGEFILEDAIGNDGVEDQVATTRVDAGAEQFFLTVNPGHTPDAYLTGANLADGTTEPDDPNLALNTSATTYIFWNSLVGAVQTNTSAFPSASAVPLWEVTLDASNNVTSKIDRRPFVVGGTSGALTDKSGIVLGSSGLDIYNTNPSAFKFVASDFWFTWDAVAGQLSWASAGGENLRIEVTDPTSDIVSQYIATASSLSGISSAGDYVYFDMDRVSASVTLQVSSGSPPTMVKDRFILGQRITDASGGNDSFVFYDSHLLLDVTDYPLASGSQIPAPLLGKDIVSGLYASNAPSGSNAIATIADITAAAGGVTSIFSAGFAGDGSDGAVTFNVAGSPHSLVFPVAGKQYTNMTIDATAIVNASTTGFSGFFGVTNFQGHAKLGVSGRLTIGGTLSGVGAGNPGAPAPTVGTQPRAGLTALNISRYGYPYGNSGAGGGSGAAYFDTSAAGGTGGTQFFNLVIGASGGPAVVAAAIALNGNPGGSGWNAAGPEMPGWWLDRSAMQSGLGGGSGGDCATNGVWFNASGAAGGGGGLTFVIECNELELQSTGSIVADGAVGGTGVPEPTNFTSSGGGGGGSAGNIIIYAKSIIDASGTLSASGGAGGPGGPGSVAVGGTGGTGGNGRYVIVKV